MKELEHSLTACFQKEGEGGYKTHSTRENKKEYWTGYGGRVGGRFDLIISYFCL